MKKLAKPLVSIIMNCHNGQIFLDKSIKSIINQKYKNWELIFWDNKSSDNSKKIIKKFKDKRIKYFYSNKFHPLYKSRNLAITKSKGEYISFLDTDDFWHKKKLIIQLNYMIKNNFKISFTNCYIYDQLNKNKYIYNNYINYKPNTQNLLNDYKLGLLTVMLHNSIFSKFKFKNKYNIIGDFEYFIRLSSSYKIGYIHQALATYRIHNNNFSKKISLYITEIENWIRLNKSFFNKKNISLKKINNFLFKLRVKNLINKIIR